MLLGQFIRMMRRWLRYRASVRELSGLSDIELADIGLTRSEITWIAWRAAKNCSSRAESVSVWRGDAIAKH